MKLFTQWRFILLSALFSLIGMGSAWAQFASLEVGKVYHFTNVGHPDKALAATYPNSVAGVAVDKDSKLQLWYVADKNESGNYALRNLAFGTYLQGNGQSSRWTLASTTDADNSWIKLETVGSNNAFKGYTYGDYGYAHIDGGSNVVGWTSSATATQWTITEKVMKPAEIQEALNIFNSVPTIQAHLDNLFSDKSCTTLKGAFNENDASFKALPATLQAMVRKVAGNNTSWEEANFDESKANWDAEYAKKYRVQLYEPYNEPECAAKALRINAHTNLNNPTGIFANKDDILYVMVEGSIEPGATLYLSYYKGHDRLAGATDGYELKQGLNVIPVYYDESNFCVNYVVNTFDTSKGYGSQAKAHRLSDYDPIKIHIEGGYINGYWNKMGDALYTADTDEDWNYIEARATQQDVVVLGKYMTLKFPLLSVHAENQTAMSQIYNEKIKVSESINEWDNIMLWERFLMGLSTKAELDNSTLVSPYSDKKIFEYTGEDYTDYYNVHGLAYSIESGKNPHAGWDYTGYPNNSMVNINADILKNAGAHWTAGHEIGHQHQGPLNMRGLTEVTNNLFSNVVLWCFGKSTSRYNGTDGALSNVLAQFNAEGTDFFSNNIWAQTIMYYKLFLYYHVLGHNPKFYPRLFEMLRQNPMAIEYNQDGSKCLMHFYKLCCEAAGEDLTEFFRAHGFFRVMEERFVGDYSNATYNLTQEQIDQAITEVKAKYYPVNLAVLFINDATGEEIQSHKGGTLALYGETRVCSEIGSYSNFNGDAANYTYGVAGNLVTMEGEGGVGFAILNEKGELIGFSDKKTFELSAEASAAIASGKASIVSIKGDNTPVVATNVMDSDNIGAKYELLGALLDNSKSILKRADATGTKVGFYRESALEGLQRTYDKAKEVYDAMNVAAYSSVYDVLFQEYVNIMSNEYARINITEGYAYRLTNKAYPDRSMAVNTENHQMFGLATAVSDAQLWYFEPGVTKNTYYLKNKGTGKYPGEVESGQVLSANKSEADKGKDNGAYAYRLQEMQPGVFALVGETGLHCSSSQSYNIVGWGADAEATQWYITANELNDALEARTKLEELIGKTEALVNEIAEYTLVNKLELQTEDNSAANYLSTNACHNTLNNASDGQGLEGLLDELTTTFFHSDYRGKVTDPHYLQVDLGENNTVEQFKFNYTTRDNGNNCPLAIKVEGSTDGSTFVELKTFTAAKDGLPNGNALSWVSPVISTEGEYRHLRFTVTEAEGSNIYFVMSTFGVSDVTPVVNEIKEGYANDASKETLKTQIKATLYKLADAHQLVDGDVADASVYNDEIQTLDPYYQELLKVVNKKLNDALDAKKAELQKWIDDANTLITECGTVTFTPGTFDGRAKLQTTDENDRFYIWTNAQELDEGPIANLIDGDIETYFHSDYSGTNSTDGKDHHLTVNLGGVTASSFQFSYTTRHNAEANYPKTIKVYGSTDGKNFDDNEVAVITGLTAENSWTYNSDEITKSKEFTHLRFMVTENNNNNTQGGHPIFHMAEFSLTIIGRPENYAVTLNNNIGVVDEALLVAAYKEKEEAVYVKENAITETQIDEAIADLQAQYDALETAYNALAPELKAAVEAAQKFLNETPQTVGYPTDTQRATFQAVIDRHESVEAINNAKTAFVETTDINLPVDGKAYKIYAWWRTQTWPMTYVETTANGVFTGYVPAYAPVKDAQPTVFVCRELSPGIYTFVSNEGRYLGFQSDGITDTKNSTGTTFVAGHNTCAVVKAAVNNKKSTPTEPTLTKEELFGTVNIRQNDANGYCYMFGSKSFKYHKEYPTSLYYGETTGNAHTVYYTFVEDPDYTLNTIKMNKLEGKNQLLTGLEEGMSMSTFSAPYPTVTPKGITAYYAKAISTTTEDGESKDVAVLQKMRTAIPAGQGVVLVGEVGKSGNFKMLPAAGEEVPAELNNHESFRGTGAQSVEMGKNGVDYILGKGSKGAGFYKAKAGSTLAAGKAYFHFENAAQVRNFVLRFGGETTDIEDAVLAPATDDGAIYDLSGRRVNEVTKGGIYIKNGKKFIVK